MGEIINCTITNAKDGYPVVTADVPEGFQVRAELASVSFGDKQTYAYSGQAFSPDGKVKMFFDSVRKYVDYRYQQFPQPIENGHNADGQEIHGCCDLKAQMDELAGIITRGEISMRAFHPYSEEMQNRIRAEADTQIQKEYQLLNRLIMMQGNVMSLQFKEPFLDGGIGEYESQGKCLFIAFYRTGYESILNENYRGSMVTDSIVWNLDGLSYMVCDPADKEVSLPIFQRFAESLSKSKELQAYDEQLLQQDIRKSQEYYQQHNAMLNAAWEQHNAGWAAVERQRDMLSRDLDQFRSSLNQSMQANDAFRQAMFSAGNASDNPAAMGESSDDYIQRLRHEATMGVNTYVNEDGHETEFSTQADRVFESNLDNLSHFGTAHYYDDYVPDGFTEVRRK